MKIHKKLKKKKPHNKQKPNKFLKINKSNHNKMDKNKIKANKHLLKRKKLQKQN